MGMGPNNDMRGGLFRPVADINVTPLVDVMLVLLIIFMVTAPLLATGMKVNLPNAKTAQPLDPREPIVVSVSKDGKLALGADEIEAPRLVEAIRERIGDDTTRVIHVRGDREAPYGAVVAALDLLSAGGLTRIAIVAESRVPAETAK